MPCNLCCLEISLGQPGSGLGSQSLARVSWTPVMWKLYVIEIDLSYESNNAIS